MKKNLLITFCILLIWIAIQTSASCDDWSECPKFKRRKPYKWCYCGSLGGDNIAPVKPPKPTPPTNGDDVEHDPCTPYNPPTPNFSRPGQRISTTKCYEYIWQIQVRIVRAEREIQCNKVKNRNKRGIDVNAAHEYLVDYNRKLNNSIHVLKREMETDTPLISQLIVGGRDALPREFPHMGAVGWKSSDPDRDWKFMCGSSLISPKFAMTAAHCISASPSDTTISDIIPKIIRFGVEDIVALATDHNVEDRNISKIIPNPSYHSPQKYYDIALFELDRPIKFSKFVQPACLWTEDMSRVKEVTVTGWGVTNPGAHEGHPYLQAATLDVIDSKTCEELLEQFYNRRWSKLVDHQICAQGGMAGDVVDACQGDSGGPLQTKIPLPPQVVKKESNMYYVVGVTSFGIGCAVKGVPAVYTRVQSFLDWIEPIVWP